jgi:threonine synthase
MDVGDPSNFVRVLELFNREFEPLKQVMSSESISDEETVRTIGSVFRDHKYLLDPHGAVGWLALNRYLQQHPGDAGIFLETAHPVKFYDVVEKVTGTKVPVPDSVKTLLNKKKTVVKTGVEYENLKQYLLKDN